MKYLNDKLRNAIRFVGICALPVLLMGCPPGTVIDPQVEYDLGFVAGFAEDGEYWQGFDDSYDTVDFGPIYYTGSEIPIYDDPPYEAGYWDGVWYAYNDGYFVAYDYAFTIGFSEGYDVAFQPGYVAFLQGDTHTEYLDGGFSDGYNDGFSEGRVFGAYDYANFITFDWLDAMLDYREGTDLSVAGVSTGNSGPVFLYEYGTDPNDFAKSATRKGRDASKPGIRNLSVDKQDAPELSYRDLTPTVRSDFSVRPPTSPRSNAPLTLSTDWLDRIEAYRSALDSGKSAKTVRE